MITDYDAASLCRALYFFDGDTPLSWDFLSTNSQTGIAWGIKADGNGVDNIVFRGTSDIQDACRDVEFLPVEAKAPYGALGWVHSGFFENIPAVVAQILNRNPRGNVRFIGHSYGAAHAQLVAECLACRGVETDVFLFGEPPSTKKEPRPARSWRNGDDPVCDPPFWPYTLRKDVLKLNEPPPTGDNWGPIIGFHHIQLYQAGLAKLQAPAPIIVKTSEDAMAFEKSFEYLLVWEGGFTNDPRDPGGATNLGIIQTEYDAYRKRKGLLPQSVRYITKVEAEDIYKNEYWDVAQCDQLNPGVANATFDACVNSGNVRGVHWLQQAINQVAGHDMVPDDGKSGPQTLTAAATLPPDQLIDAMLGIRLAFMKAARNPKTGASLWATFGHGWNDRIIGVRKQSHDLAGLPAPSKPLPSQADVSVSTTPATTPQATIKETIPMTTAAPVTATIPVASSSAIIPASVNNLLALVLAATTYITSSGIDVTSIVNTLTHGNFWAGLIATGAVAAVNHVITKNSNSATVAAITNAASTAATVASSVASAVQAASATANQIAQSAPAGGSLTVSLPGAMGAVLTNAASMAVHSAAANPTPAASA